MHCNNNNCSKLTKALLALARKLLLTFYALVNDFARPCAMSRAMHRAYLDATTHSFHVYSQSSYFKHKQHYSLFLLTAAMWPMAPLPIRRATKVEDGTQRLLEDVNNKTAGDCAQSLGQFPVCKCCWDAMTRNWLHGPLQSSACLALTCSETLKWRWIWANNL